MATLKTYPVNLLPDPGFFPRDLFDARWKDPKVTARIAFESYRRLRYSVEFDQNELQLGEWPHRPHHLVDERSVIATPQKVPERGTHLVGSAVNELHRRTAFSGGRPTVNVHAQAVTWGADDEGRWFLHATLGRMGGEDGNTATIGVSFGGHYFEHTLDVDPPEDQKVLFHGTHPGLVKDFATLGSIRVRLYIEHHEVKKNRSDRERSAEAISLFGE